MSMISKVQTIMWFLRRPFLYSQLAYLFYQRLFPHPKEATREESTKWCAERAVTSGHAIRMITGRSDVQPLTELFPSFFINASQIIAKLPVKLGGNADLELLYYLAIHAGSKRAVETGVAYGWSSTALLFALRAVDGVLYSTDMPYAKMDNEGFVGCIIPDELRSRWTLVTSPDRAAVPRIIGRLGTIDISHYDSDKSYRGRMWAYPRLWNALKKGGVFISDDVSDNTAFKDFALKVGVAPIIVDYPSEHKYIGILIKP